MRKHQRLQLEQTFNDHYQEPRLITAALAFGFYETAFFWSRKYV